MATLDREPLAGGSGLELALRRSDAFDRAIEGLFEPFAHDGLAVLAVGGYGWRELAPGSDVDLLFVLEPGREEEGQRAAEAVLYPLWDAGFTVSHAVRTPAECEEEAERELRSLTALLSARALAGGRPGSADEVLASAIEVIDGDRAGFVARIRRSREDRAGRFGEVARTLQPDLKESLGGLRDVQVLGWLAFAIRGSPRTCQAGLAEWLAGARDALRSGEQDFLLLVRTALHRATGLNSNVLLADQQADVAKALGLDDEEGWERRDLLMREVFRAGQWVECLTDGALDWAEGTAGAPSTDDVAPRALSTDFPDFAAGSEDVGGFLEGVAGRFEQGDPALALDLLRLAARVASIPVVEWSPGVLASFIRLLAAPGADRALELLDTLGMLVRLLPEWNDVRGRPQRDPYHLYPVDAHLFQTVAEAGRRLRHPDEPFAMAAVRAVDDPSPVLLGALLHDIGKVGKGSHGPIGVEVTERVLDRMGIAGELREDVLFLVGEHLLLSDTATRRNLEDEDLVLHVAARIRDERRLALLYLLTLADGQATGPTACTPWRLGLLRDLVAKVSHAFERGLMDPDRAGRLERAEAVLRDALVSVAFPPEDAEAFARAMPPGYVLWVAPEEAPDHLALIVPRPGQSEVRTAVRPGRSTGTHRLALGAVDRLGLLAAVAGSMTLAGLSILGAQAFTTEDGLALDVFEVRGAFEEEVGEGRLGRFRELLGEALEGKLDLRERVHSLGAHYRPAPGGIPVTVGVDEEASDFYTVVEVSAPDRLGLLFDLASTLAQHDLDVHVAKVATYGPRVVDVFYVRDSAGQKLGDPARAAELERSLKAAASQR